MNGLKWTDFEIKILKEAYDNDESLLEISKKINRTISAIESKANDLGITSKTIKKNNIKFKAVYQDYNWCYDKFINHGMSMKEMADEAGAKLRVVKKWCSEKHRLNDRTFRKEKKLTEQQKQLIMFGRLGDGHIDKRENQPMYIEVHAENQKDYLFWKWSILKDICNHEPIYYPNNNKYFNEVEYKTQATYRLNTRIIDDLIPIRAMSISEIILQLNEFGLCLHLLDDGHRNKSNWFVCLAEYTQEEKDLYIKTCKEKFALDAKIIKDDRYIEFDAISSRIIDSMILKHIPNNLDIVQYKIINNNIPSPANYVYVEENGKLIGLNTFCRKNGLVYKKCKKYVDDVQTKQISAIELYNLRENNYETIR